VAAARLFQTERNPGRLAAALGDDAAAGDSMRRALELFRELGATGHADRLARELGA